MKEKFKIIKTVLIGFGLSIVLTILYYVLFSLIVDTDVERKLKSENRLYEKNYPQMRDNEILLNDVILGLQLSDRDLYNLLFNALPPTLGVDLNNDAGYLDVESLESGSAEKRNSKSVQVLEDKASRIEANFKAVLEKCEDKSSSLPPLTNPLKNIDASKIGASMGYKLNPFYKVKVEHKGLDIIAPIDTPVYATADGYVSAIEHSTGGKGNMVTLKHKDGYITKYAHLHDINVVRYRRVKQGQQIGTIGVSGKSFAPHLHYEVLIDTLNVNPVNYMFASITPKEYIEYLYMSISTGQSMD